MRRTRTTSTPSTSIGLLDVPHKVTISPIVELPLGVGKRWANSGLSAALLGDWTISSIIEFESGFALAVSTPMLGQTVTHYRIVDTLGSGGMGVVYLAEDTRLRRQVALKFLPVERTQDEEAKRRFVIEAQAASALDHPNIGTIYEIDEAADGRLFIAMAYYAGETLKAKIARGPIALSDAIDYARQIASGLVKAHAAGIVHRDIKPANLLVTADGLVKIVDFGVAKLFTLDDLTRTELTGVGVAIGTPTYMSPEQSVGVAADVRSDIWALGVVLYEMVTGRLPTSGDHSSPAASIIAEGPPPPLSSVRPEVPAELDRLAHRMLAQRADDRYQTASDLLAELRLLAPSSATASQVGSATVAAPQTTRHRSMTAPLVALGAVALAAIAYALWARPGTDAEPLRLTNPRQLATSVGVELLPSWSADGKIIAYQSDQTGNNDIWVMQVGSPAVNRTADFPGGDEAPRLSPDGRQIAFWSARDGGGVFLMPTLGGSPRKISIARADVAMAPAWSADGQAAGNTDWRSRRAGEPRLDYTDGRDRRDSQGAAQDQPDRREPNARSESMFGPRVVARPAVPRLCAGQQLQQPDGTALGDSVERREVHQTERQHLRHLESELVSGQSNAVLHVQSQWGHDGSVATAFEPRW